MNYSAAALVAAEVGLFVNAVTWALTGHDWPAAGFAVAMWLTWRLKGWVIA